MNQANTFPTARRPLTGARLVVSLLALFTAVSPYVADFNRTHVYNPYWPGHARFHNGQTMTFGLLSGLLTLYFLWGKSTGPALENWRVACLLAALYWLALVPARFYPGATLTDPRYGGRPIDVVLGVPAHGIGAAGGCGGLLVGGSPAVAGGAGVAGRPAPPLRGPARAAACCAFYLWGPIDSFMSAPVAPAAQSTEERIREAARRVFLEKGYDGTTSRDLAKASGLNVSMTNYYFRSKEKLFQLTFQDLHRTNFARLNILVNADLPLREKIEQLLASEYELVVANPDLPLFIMHEMRRHPDLFANEVVRNSPYPTLRESVFARQVEAAVASGELKPIDPLQIIMLIVSNVHYPFVGRAVITQSLAMTDAELTALVHRHQPVVREMIIGYLFGPAHAT